VAGNPREISRPESTPITEATVRPITIVPSIANQHTVMKGIFTNVSRSNHFTPEFVRVVVVGHRKAFATPVKNAKAPFFVDSSQPSDDTPTVE